MIVTKDIEEILITDLSSVIDVGSIYGPDDIPAGKVTSERVVIIPKETRTEKYFNKCFVEVNWCVPDLGDYPNSLRLQEVERVTKPFFDKVGQFDGTTYRYGIESSGIKRDKDLECHYVNTRVLFEIINTINP